MYGTRTTGAENDIEQATNLARNMVTRWGMSDAVGLVQLAPRENAYLGGVATFQGSKPFSEATEELVDSEVQRIIGECHTQAKDLLVANRNSLDALVKALLERETLTEEEVLAIAEHEHLPEIAAAALAQYVLSQEHGTEKVRDMIVDDIRQAQRTGDRQHVLALLHVLHHFLKTLPEAVPSQHLWSKRH